MYQRASLSLTPGRFPFGEPTAQILKPLPAKLRGHHATEGRSCTPQRSEGLPKFAPLPSGGETVTTCKPTFRPLAETAATVALEEQSGALKEISSLLREQLEETRNDRDAWRVTVPWVGGLKSFLAQ